MVRKPARTAGVAEERPASAGRDFLEKHDVGQHGPAEDVVEDESRAFVGLGLGGLDVPRRVGQRLPASCVSDCGARGMSRAIGVAQRYGRPSIAGGVEGRGRSR